jgi:hypothetical protein
LYVGVLCLSCLRDLFSIDLCVCVCVCVCVCACVCMLAACYQRCRSLRTMHPPLRVGASYSIPVIVGMTIMPNKNDWVDGAFSTQGADKYGWLGISVTVGAVLSNVGNYQASLGAGLAGGGSGVVASHAAAFLLYVCNCVHVMCTLAAAASSRALWAMGGGAADEVPDPMLPAIFARTWSVRGTEVPAFSILLCSAISLLMCTLRFETLMLFDVFFSAAMLLFQFAAFGWLRYSQPTRPRPYAVPGGWMGVAACLVLPCVMLLTAMATAGTLVLLGGLGCNLVFVLAFYSRQCWRDRQRAAVGVRGADRTPLVAAV